MAASSAPGVVLSTRLTRVWPRVPTEWLVAGMLFLLFTRVSDLYGAVRSALTVNQVTVAVLALAILVRSVIPPRRRPVWHGGLTLMLLYGAAIALSAISAEDRWATVGQVVVHLREVLIALVVVNMLTTEGSLRLASWSLIVGGACVAAWELLGGAMGTDLGGLAQVNVGNIAGDAGGVRFAGIIGNSNALAQMLLCVAPLAVYRGWAERSICLRLTAFGALWLLIVGIIWTFSRGGALALAVVLVLAMIMQRQRRRDLLFLLGTLVLVLPVAPGLYWDRAAVAVEYVAAGLARPQPTATVARATEATQTTHSPANVVVQTSQPESDQGPIPTPPPPDASSPVLAIPAPPEDTGSLQERSELLRIGALMFFDHPLFGVGKGDYILAYPRYVGRVNPKLALEPKVTHSTPIQILADTGLVGLLTFMAAVGAAIWMIRRTKRTFGTDTRKVLLIEPLELGIYAYLISSLFMSDDFPRYLWLLIGLGIVANRLGSMRRQAEIPR